MTSLSSDPLITSRTFTSSDYRVRYLIAVRSIPLKDEGASTAWKPSLYYAVVDPDRYVMLPERAWNCGGA